MGFAASCGHAGFGCAGRGMGRRAGGVSARSRTPTSTIRETADVRRSRSFSSPRRGGSWVVDVDGGIGDRARRGQLADRSEDGPRAVALPGIAASAISADGRRILLSDGTASG